MPRTIDPEKRKKILEAALGLFARNNYYATSTADIARAAGIAAGTLFLYFPTKQDLLHALVLEISWEQAAYVQSHLADSLSVRETFFAIWQSSIHWFMAHLDAYALVQQVRDSGLVSDAVVAETGKALSYYFAVVGQGMQEGNLKPYAPEMIGGFLYQDIVAVMNYVRAESDPVHREDAIRQGFKIFWDGIRL